MLRSRGISQICHTYLEDMHPIIILRYHGYIPLGSASELTTVAEDIPFLAIREIWNRSVFRSIN